VLPKRSTTGIAAKPSYRKVLPTPCTVSNLRQTPVTETFSSRDGTSERIVPVFTSRFRTAVPRGKAETAKSQRPVMESQPTSARSSENTLHPGAVAKPSFAGKSGLPTKYDSASTAADPSNIQKPIADRKQALGTCSSSLKTPTPNNLTPGRTFQVGISSGKPTPKASKSHLPNSAASPAVNSCDSIIEPPLGTNSTLYIQPATPKFSANRLPNSVAGRALSAINCTEQPPSGTAVTAPVQPGETISKFPSVRVQTSSMFSVTDVEDLTLDVCPPACPNPHLERTRASSCELSDRSSTGCHHKVPGNQKRKVEVCYRFE